MGGGLQGKRVVVTADAGRRISGQAIPVDAFTYSAGAWMGKGLAIAALAGFLLLVPMQRAAADDMMTVGQLLQDCHTNSTVCAQDFGSSAINMAFLWGGNCIPAKLTRQQTDMAVLRWLSAHQDIAQEDAPDGIADAVGALWPCGSP